MPLTVVKTSRVTGIIHEMEIPFSGKEYTEFWLDYESRKKMIADCRHVDKLSITQVMFLATGAIPLETFAQGIER